MYSMYACMYLPDAQHVSDKHPTHGGADEIKERRSESRSLSSPGFCVLAPDEPGANTREPCP